MDRKDWVGIVLLLILLSLAFYAWSLAPESIPKHWDASGEPDAWGSRTNLFLFPGIALAVYLLLLFIPKIAVKKKAVMDFRGGMPGMRVAMTAFFLIIFLGSALPIIGFDVEFLPFMIVAMSGLFIYLSWILPTVKQNYLIGIRTPWTLASEKVWDETHKLGGTLFAAVGWFSLLGLLFNSAWIWILMVSLLGSIIYLFVYSYRLWKR